MTQDAAATNQKKKRRNVWLIAISLVFLIAAILGFLYWIFIGRFYVYTEDSYVHGNRLLLAPQVASGVKGIYADETDLVTEGQLIVELDTSDFEIRVEELKKNLAQVVREISRIFQDANAKQAEVDLRRAQLRQAELDFNHREPLVKTGAVSVEEYQIYETAVRVAEASLRFAEKEYGAIQALITNTTITTHPRVQNAIWVLKEAFLNLIRCKIYAPSTGFIAKRSAQVGDQVNMGSTLLYIIPLDEIWINANYKETQLKNVRIGQTVTYTADIYGRSVRFQGHVEGFQPGSGDAFALLPPQNASGNWIKIIQRVPVRIRLDCEEIKKNPLLIGLSTRMTIDVHDRSGDRLATVPTKKQLFFTHIYDKQMEELAGYSPLIEEIIESNLSL